MKSVPEAFSRTSRVPATKPLWRVFYVTTINVVKIEFDNNKNQRNIRERGLSFELVAAFDFETALIIEDTRPGQRQALRPGVYRDHPGHPGNQLAQSQSTRGHWL